MTFQIGIAIHIYDFYPIDSPKNRIPGNYTYLMPSILYVR